MEIWKDIEGYEWLYQISSHSRVKSLRFWKEKILKQRNDNRWWYPYVNLYYKKSISKKVHRLLAIHFIPNPLNLPLVLHNDNNPRNCTIDNLRWWTTKDNMIQMTNDGNNRNKWRFWKNHYLSVKINQYSLDWTFIKTWDSIVDVTRDLNIDNSWITKCCRWKNKTAWWFKWKYI